MSDILALKKNRFHNPDRIQMNLLSNVEKKFLIWIAKRLPEWVHSDHLTVLGFFGMILAGASYAFTSWISFAPHLSTAFLIMNWFGDSLDGTLARVRNRQRPRYGFYVDHVLDTIGIFFLFVGLAISGFMNPWIAIGFLLAYYVVCIEIYLGTISFGQFKMSFGIFGPTELRILLAIGNIVLPYHPKVHLFGHEFFLFDVGFMPGIIVMVILAIHSTIKNTIRLYREEPIPDRREPKIN